MNRIANIKLLKNSFSVILTALILGLFASCAGAKAFTQERVFNRGVMSQSHKDGIDTTQGIFIETKDEVRTRAKEIIYFENGKEEFFEVDGKKVEVENVFRVQTKDGYFHNYNSRLLPRFITGSISYYSYFYETTERIRNANGSSYTNTVTKQLKLLEKDSDGKLKSFTLNTLKRMTSDHDETNKMVKKVIKGYRLKSLGLIASSIGLVGSALYIAGLYDKKDNQNPPKSAEYILPGVVLVGSSFSGSYLFKKRKKADQQLLELIEFYNNNK